MPVVVLVVDIYISRFFLPERTYLVEYIYVIKAIQPNLTSTNPHFHFQTHFDWKSLFICFVLVYTAIFVRKQFGNQLLLVVCLQIPSVLSILVLH